MIENDTLIKEAIPHLNKYRKIAGINTCISKAHFLAQLSQESKFYVLEEGFNYYWEALISTFSAFQSEEGRKKAKLWGRKIKDRNTKGYEPVTPANEINIANWAYKDDNKNGSFSSGDGSRYRGRGFKQITWKSNYIDLSDFFNTKMKIASDTSVNWKDNYTSLTRSPTDAMISALAFWKKNNLSNIAIENSNEGVKKVTKKINPAFKGLEERQAFFKRAVDVLKVNDCKPKNDKDKDKSKGNLSTFDGKYKANTGEVYINVITPITRDLQGPLIVFDDKKILFKTHSLCRGSNNDRLKAAGNGDTPTGRTTTSYDAKRHNGEWSYGSYGSIYLEGESGEFLKATKNGRDGIAIHCGHTTGYNKKSLKDLGKLMGTFGCIRVYNDEMKKLGELYTELKKQGKKIYCYIEDYDGNIKDVYKKYDMEPDPKDSSRGKRSKTQ